MVRAQPYLFEEEPPLIDINTKILITQPEQTMYSCEKLDQHIYMIGQGNRGYNQPQQCMYEAVDFGKRRFRGHGTRGVWGKLAVRGARDHGVWGPQRNVGFGKWQFGGHGTVGFGARQ